MSERTRERQRALSVGNAPHPALAADGGPKVFFPPRLHTRISPFGTTPGWAWRVKRRPSGFGSRRSSTEDHSHENDPRHSPTTVSRHAGGFGRQPVRHHPRPWGGKLHAAPTGRLGPTGITLSRVGQGTGMRGGNRQSNHTRMGFDKLVTLFRHDYDQGVTFYDLADLYGSHVYFREALRSIRATKWSS